MGGGWNYLNYHQSWLLSSFLLFLLFDCFSPNLHRTPDSRQKPGRYYLLLWIRSNKGLVFKSLEVRLVICGLYRGSPEFARAIVCTLICNFLSSPFLFLLILLLPLHSLFYLQPQSPLHSLSLNLTFSSFFTERGRERKRECAWSSFSFSLVHTASLFPSWRHGAASLLLIFFSRLKIRTTFSFRHRETCYLLGKVYTRPWGFDCKLRHILLSCMRILLFTLFHFSKQLFILKNFRHSRLFFKGYISNCTLNNFY